MLGRRRPCDRYAELLSGADDAEAIDLELRRHVRSCAQCHRELHQYRRIRGVLRALPSQFPLPNPLDSRRIRRRRLVLSGAAGGIGIVSVAVAVSARRRRP